MTLIEWLSGGRIGSFIGRSTGKVREINRKYAKPKITMSPGVRFALLMLRLYLIFLVLLLAYKFWTILEGAA